MTSPRLIQRGPVVMAPYGGRLVNLFAAPERAEELRASAKDRPTLEISAREMADLEMLATGAFSPLTGFLGRADYESVRRRGRLADGRLWPVPVMLSAPVSLVERLAGLTHPAVSLVDSEGSLVAALTVDDMWEPDGHDAEPSTHAARDGRDLFDAPKGHAFLSGRLEIIERPLHPDFAGFRRDPAKLRESFEQLGLRRWLAYRPRALLHRTHVDTLRRFGQMNAANVLILGAIGATSPAETRYHARVRAWRAALEQFPAGVARLTAVNYVPRPSGAAAETLNAIVARNFGASHYVVEHDHDARLNEPRYGEFTVQESLLAVERELGIEMVLWRDMVYEEDRPEEFLAGHARAGRCADALTLDAARAGEIARWFSYPSVLHEWQKPLRSQPATGLAILITGRHRWARSAVAKRLTARLMEIGDQYVILLDSPERERELAPGGISGQLEHDAHARRLGCMAGMVAEQRGIAVCAPMAPGARTRADIRARIEEHGAYVEVHVTASPLSRDDFRAGAVAADAESPGPSAASLVYEPPEHPDVVVDLMNITATQAVEKILVTLAAQGRMSTGDAWALVDDVSAGPDVAPVSPEPAGPTAGRHDRRAARPSSGQARRPT